MLYISLYVQKRMKIEYSSLFWPEWPSWLELGPILTYTSITDSKVSIGTKSTSLNGPKLKQFSIRIFALSSA